MNKLLHIIATPRGDDSRTLKVSNAFLGALKEKNPGCMIDELNVSTAELPSLTVKVVSGKYALLAGMELSEGLKKAWEDVLRHIERFLAADMYLISTPMWNLSIPYPLKHYIDVIVQPRYLFRYTANGAEGLAKNKKMVVITSRGGEYGPSSPSHAYDLQEPYLRTIFGFVGITDISFIIAEPMDMGDEIRKARLEAAKKRACEIAGSLSC